jgi:protein-disulfide isomerase
MKPWKPSLSLGLALTCILSVPPASAQQPPRDELKKDIEILKEAVIAIQKDVQEIKALLQSRQPTPPSQVVVLDLGKNPFKGERTAKLTLVEFSDYQ